MAIPSKADRYTENKVKEVVYSDFLTNFGMHPEKKDLFLVTNENAVKQSIRNLIMTDSFSRVWEPTISSSLRRLLFELPSRDLESTIVTRIKTLIENHEPRARLVGVTATAYHDQKAYAVNIVFYTVNIQTPIALDLVLYRVR